MNKSANLLELESLRTELIEKTFNSSSYLNKLFLFVNYFEKILSLNNPNYNEAFLKEFIEDYLTSIKKFDGWSSSPAYIKKLIVILDILGGSNSFLLERTFIQDEAARLKKQLEILENILEGKTSNTNIEYKAFFPLIDKENSDEFYGVIDSITVRINKCNDANKFIIVPSEKDLEKKIEIQVKTSWDFAISQSKKYLKKTFQFHEVLINFDKRVGFYEGNSLGISLTLSFLEQLLKFYNPTYLIDIKERTAFTGGVKQSGQILDTSEDIIKRKVAAIFFSEINLFVIPKLDESYAYFALTQLKQKYPNRNLKIIAVEDFTDVLNRRDIVDIKKQKLIVRSGKFIKKNWISAVATVLLAILFAYLFVMDFDDNPSSVMADGQTLFIKNKNDKILFTLPCDIAKDYIDNNRFVRDYIQIVDVDEDNINEIIYTSRNIQMIGSEYSLGTVICFNNKKIEKWKYTFRDTVVSRKENLQPIYGVSLIDTCEYENNNVLFCSANNAYSFSSAIFMLDLKTGIRLKNTLWCSGYTWDGIITKFDDDSIKYFVGVGADNGFGAGAVWGISLENFNGVRPSTEQYTIQNFPEADLLFYIQIPKTDLGGYIGSRIEGILDASLEHNKSNKKIKFTTHVANDTIKTNSLHYYLDENFLDVDIFVTDQLSRVRDSLVIRGLLQKPFTDTKEYVEIIKNKVLYYSKGLWLNRMGMVKK